MGKLAKHKESCSDVQSVWKGPGTLKMIAIIIGGLFLYFAALGLVAMVAASGSVSARGVSATAQQSGRLVPANNGVQEMTVSMQGRYYQPNPIRVKAGVPVRMTIDFGTVRGCFRSVQIPELGVRIAPGSNVIEFTPSKPGTFRMTCSMGMADGTLIVEDENGYAPPAAPRPAGRTGGSCGSGGGCGCGG